jgi:hypothetical protein
LINKLPTGNLLLSRIDASTNALVPIAVLMAATGKAYSLKETETSNCSVCTGKKMSQALCQKLQTLAQRGNNSPAVEKLCANLTTNLESVVDRLLAFTDNAVIQVFLGDIQDPCGGNAYLCGNVSSLTVDLVEAWKVVYDAKGTYGYKKDYALLNQTKAMQTNATLLQNLDGREGLKTIIVKNIAAPCYTCQSTTHAYLKKMDEYLKDVAYFGNNCSEKEGYRTVIGSTGLQGQQYAVEGAAFMLRVLADGNLASQVDKFEQIYNTANEKVVDIVHANGKLIECKSWTIGSGAFVFFKTGRTAQGGSFAQFTSYLQNGISNMTDLEYWFDSKKESSETKLKEEFQTMMLQNNALTLQGNDVFDAIWANPTLRGNLWTETVGLNANDLSSIKPSILAKFQIMVSNTSNGFYNFIKVK